MLEYRKTAKEIKKITQDMLDFSQQNAWEEVANAEQDRQLLLVQLAKAEPQEFDGASEKLLQDIIKINTQIELLSRQKMEDCRLEYNEVKNKKNAISAYTAF